MKIPRSPAEERADRLAALEAAEAWALPDGVLGEEGGDAVAIVLRVAISRVAGFQVLDRLGVLQRAQALLDGREAAGVGGRSRRRHGGNSLCGCSAIDVCEAGHRSLELFGARAARFDEPEPSPSGQSDASNEMDLPHYADGSVGRRRCQSVTCW